MMAKEDKLPLRTAFTVDVEDWFHVLSTSDGPSLSQWSGLESRIGRNLDKIFEMLDRYGARATFFWLGWMADTYPQLVKRTVELGHEVASHGYAHLLPDEATRDEFMLDLRKAKDLLENLTGKACLGYRAPGFGISHNIEGWQHAIREIGHIWDSSIFPAHHGHGGSLGAQLSPHIVQTPNGPLVELPVSAIEVNGKRLAMFGGGFLRLTPRMMLRWGMNRLAETGRPLISYTHPREIDPAQPRLNMNMQRSFRMYVNLTTTATKLHDICARATRYMTMSELAAEQRPEIQTTQDLRPVELPRAASDPGLLLA